MSSIPQTRICSTCGIEKLLTKEFFGMDKRYSFGFRGQCRSCQNAKARERDRLNPEKVKAKAKRMYAIHGEKRRKYSQEYRKNNPEKAKESNKKSRLKHPERVLRNKREYAEKYPDYQKNRRRKSPDKFRIYGRIKRQEYRARKRNAEGKYSPEIVASMYNEQEGRCAYCGITLHDEFHVDHILALIRGGTNLQSNLVIACAHCNQSKREKTLNEWMEKRGW